MTTTIRYNIQANSAKMLTMAKLTRNEKYLPEHLKLLLRCIEQGINTTRKLMELNPLNHNAKCEKSIMGSYGRHLANLHKMGFLDRDLSHVDNTNTYVYRKAKLIPMKLDLPKNCFLDI